MFCALVELIDRGRGRERNRERRRERGRQSATVSHCQITAVFHCWVLRNSCGFFGRGCGRIANDFEFLPRCTVACGGTFFKLSTKNLSTLNVNQFSKYLHICSWLKAEAQPPTNSGISCCAETQLSPRVLISFNRRCISHDSLLVFFGIGSGNLIRFVYILNSKAFWRQCQYLGVNNGSPFPVPPFSFPGHDLSPSCNCSCRCRCCSWAPD